MDRSTATTRAARAGACALLAAALLPLPTAQASTGTADDPAQAVLTGEVVEVVVEDGPSHAEHGDEHDHHDAPAGLQLDDGTTVGVEGLAETGAVSGEEVRLVVDVPAALEDAVADAAGERRLDAARERPAAEGSAIAEAVVAAATDEGAPLAAAEGTVRTTAEAPQPATAAAIGPARPVTVVVADMGEGTERVPTDADLASMVDRASDYWSDQSAGRVTFALAGTPTRYSTALTCQNVWTLWDEAKKQAGFASGQRAHLVVVLLDEAGKGCGYGVGSVGSGVDAGGVSALDNAADLSLVAHELGHNLSLNHANSLECSTEPRQDVVGSPAAPCRVQEYGDLVDVMAASSGTLPGALSAMARARVGFLEADERATVTAAGTTTVDLAPLAGAAGAGVKDLSVTDPRTGAVYRLENRQAADRDADRLSRFRALPGLRVLRLQPGSTATLALDGTPTAQSSSADTNRALPAGQVWRSASGGVEVRTTALADGRVRASVSLARAGETHGALATTTSVDAAELVRGRAATLRGTVTVTPGSVAPQGEVTVDVAGARATAPVGADGAFAVEVTPVLGGEQTLRADYVPADAARWATSSTSRTVAVAEDPTATGVTVTVGTAAGGPLDAATPALLDVRLDGADAVDGTVVVSEGGERLASAAVADGAARVELPVLPGGAHELAVAYDGGSASRPDATVLALDVAQVTSSTTVSVVTSPTASRAAVLQARVASAAGATGTVQVRLDTRVLASGPVAGTGTRLALPVLPVGTHDLVVAFAGDRSVTPSQASLRLAVAKDATTLEVVPPKSPTTAGGQVVVARVRAGNAAATGVVRLVVDGRTTTKAELVRGEARLPLPKLAAGRRTVTVSYDGSGTALPVAQALRVDVVRASGTTAAKPATTAPARGRTTTLTVAVTSPAGTPTGDVVLRDDRGRALARGTLSGGRVTLTQPALRKGTYRFVVEHAGDALTAPSRSAAWTVRVR